MRTISVNAVTEAVARLCVEANLYLGSDIICALRTAAEAETGELPRYVLDTLLQNADIAARERLPLCQDTGMAVVFLEVGQDIRFTDGLLTEAVQEGVMQGYRDLRKSVVSDPIRRVNTGNNCPAVIHVELVAGDGLRITVAPKGFGSENMSALAMLVPSDGMGGVLDFVVETVRLAGSNPCPPIIVGAGVGGTMEKAALLAKRALLRPVGSVHPDPFWAEAERTLLERINALDIGPGGFHGKTTALAAHFAVFPTHIAGLPVAVNIGCHATRHKTLDL